jgi:hypothetical protein
MTVGYDGLHYYYGHICRLSTGAGAQYSGYLSHCMSAAIPDLGCATACPSADTDEYMVCCEACCRAASAIKKKCPRAALLLHHAHGGHACPSRSLSHLMWVWGPPV